MLSIWNSNPYQIVSQIAELIAVILSMATVVDWNEDVLMNEHFLSMPIKYIPILNVAFVLFKKEREKSSTFNYLVHDYN